MDSKSKTVRKLARKRGVKFVNVPLSMMDPKDLRGLPQADPEMQAAFAQMVRDREVGNHKLGDK